MSHQRRNEVTARVVRQLSTIRYGGNRLRTKREFLLRRYVSRFCLTMALVVTSTLATTPVFADVLVSNIKQGFCCSTGLGSWDAAQAFTTGANAEGYTLTDIVIPMAATPTGVSIKVTTGSPTGTVLATLTNPETLSNGNNTFTAPDGTSLSANTTYVVIIEGSGGTISSGNVDGEDSEGLSDWSISNNGYHRQASSSGAWTEDTNSKKIQVNGSVIGSSDPEITISGGNAVTEGTAAQFTLTASSAPAADLTVNLTVADATGSDFVASSDEGDKTVTITATTTTATYAVTTQADTTDEPNGDVTVTVKTGTGYTVGSTDSAMVTVNDDDDTNSPATGAPSISGFPQVGQTLTASTSGISDSDGLTSVSYSYQWIRIDGMNEANIASATSSTYVLAAADSGKTVKVKVTFADDAGNNEALTSAATSSVVPKAPACTTGNAWCATLTVGVSTRGGTGTANGYCLSVTGVCTTSYGNLSDTDFTLDGTTYNVKSIRWGAGSGGTKLHFTLGSALSASEVSRLTLNVDSNALGLSDAATGNKQGTLANNYNWSSPTAVRGYGVGRKVTVELMRATLPTVTISTSATSVTEGTSVDFTVTSNPAPSANLQVSLTVADVSGSDFLAAAAEGTQTVTINATETTATHTVATQSDTTHEQNGLITVTVATDDDYTVGDNNSASVTVNDDDNATPTGSVTIDGTVKQGQTLTANTSDVADGDGLGDFSYQWIRGSTNISGAMSSTYTLVSADVGQTIKVEVSWTDDGGTDESLTSDATAAVAHINGSVAITGTATQGQTLTADTSNVSDPDGPTNLTFSYQWIRGGTNIAGATSSTYALVQADVGQTIKVTVSWTDSGNNAESLTSDATSTVANVNDSPTGSVSITGSATKGQTLTADTTGISDPDGPASLTFSYQWIRGSTGIAGATSSTYTLVQADVGQTIKVTVSWTDAGNTSESLTSDATATVADVDTTAPTISSVTISSTASVDTNNDNTADTYVIGDTITIDFTFNEPVTYSGGDSSRIRMRLDLGADDTDYSNSRKVLSSPTISGSRLRFSYTVVAGDLDADGIWIQTNTATTDIVLFGPDLSLLTDSSNNRVRNTFSGLSTTGDASHKVDGVRSEFSSATVNGSALEVTFSKTLDASGATKPASSIFTVTATKNSTDRTVNGSSTAVTINGKVVSATLASAVAHDETVKVDYAAPSANPLEDLVGNDVSDFDDEDVTNNTPSPSNPSITISGGAAVTEGTAAQFTVTASPAPAANLTVNLSVSDASGSDFVASGNEGNKTVTINANTTSATYSVTTQSDTTDEPNGDVTVTVKTGSGYTVGATSSSASVTVNDDDNALSFSFTDLPTATAWGIGGVIELTATFQRSVTVDTSFGTPRIKLTNVKGPSPLRATRHASYVSGSGSAELVFRYTVVEGDYSENIDSNRTTPTVGIAANSLNLHGGTIKAGTNDVEVTHDSADSSRHVLGVRSIFRFAGAGDLYTNDPSTDFSPKIDANLDGHNESYTAELGNNQLWITMRPGFPPGYLYGFEVDYKSNKANVHIVVDIGGTEVTLNFSSAESRRNRRSTGAVIFGPHTIVAANSDADGIVVKRDDSGNIIRLLNGATIKGAANDGGNVAIVSWNADVNVSIPTDNATNVLVRGTNAVPTGTDVAKTTAVDTDLTFAKSDFTITDSDNDPLKEVRIATLPANTAGVLELDSTEITSDALPQTITHAELDAGDLVFKPVSTYNGAASFTFKVVDSFGSEAAAANTASITVGSPPPTITITAGTSPVTEGAGAQFTVTANPAPAADLTVNLSVSEATGSDFVASTDEGNKTVTIKANKTTATYSVTTQADTTDESNSSVTVTVSTGTGYTVGSANSASVTVNDDDDVGPAITITAGTSPVTEGTAAEFTITASEAPMADLTVNLTVTDVTGSDFVASDDEGAKTVTITNGTTSASYSVTTQSDTVDEESGSVTVTVDAGTGYNVGSSNSASVTVNDDDLPAITVSGGDAVTEGTAAKFTLTASTAPTSNLTVNLTVADATNSDFIDSDDEGSKTVSITANSTSAIYSVDTTSDTKDELNGTISVTVASGTGYTIGSPSSGTVTVNDDDATANRSPVFTNQATTASINENSAAGTTVETISATDPESDAITYSLDSTSDAKFNIDSSDGEITVQANDSLDHEANASITATVTATDSNNNASTHELVITINDQNEPPDAPGAPTVAATSGSTTSIDVSWTAPSTTGKPDINDYDVQYKKSTETSWTDHSFSGTGTSTSISSLDANSTYNVQVKAKNPEGDSAWSPTGSASTSNTTPTFSSQPTTATINENSAAGTTVVTVLATDPDSGDSVTHSLDSTSDGLFNIDATTGKITVQANDSLDHEARSSITATVTATDNQNASATHDVAITIADQNEPPTAPGEPTVSGASTTSISVSWTAPTNTGKPAINDYDVQFKVSSATTWTAHSFTGIGTSTTISSLSPAVSYDVQIKAKNAEGDSGWSATGSGTTDNTAPTFSSPPSTLSIAENSSGGTNVGTVSATDADGHTLTFSLDTTTAGSFDISNSGVITVKSNADLDHEAKSSFSSTVTVNDGTVDVTHSLMINVTDENEPPGAPTSVTVSATSGSTTSIDVSWTAPSTSGIPAISDYDVQHRVSGVEAWTDSSIDTTSTSASIASLLAGTSYEVQVRAHNAEGTSGWSSTGSGDTSNTAPTFTSPPSSLSVNENSGGGTSVGTVGATDADGHTLTFSLDTTTAGSFNISNTGAITVKSGATLDHEAKSSFSTTVTVEDGRSDGTVTHSVTINIADLNEPPAAPGAPTVAATSGSTTSIDISWTAPSTTGKPPISDYDVQYRVSGEDDWTDAEYDSTTASTTIGSLLAGTTYEVQVKAHNDEGASAWSLTGSGDTNNTPPSFTSPPSSLSVNENTAGGTTVGTVAATDADGHTLTFELDTTTDGSFNISSSGVITVQSGADLNHEAKSSFSTTVTVRDGRSNGTVTHSLTINIDDVLEPPGTPPGTPGVTGASTTSIAVTWTAPNMTGKPPISDYDIRQRVEGTTAWTDSGIDTTSTSATIASLLPGTTYEVQVQAHNDEGTSSWSATGSGDTLNTPPVFTSPPSSLTINENSASGTSAGTVAATDADGHSLTFSLNSTTDAVFDISSNGTITLQSGASLDYEATTSYSTTVTVSDGRSDGIVSHSFAINVGDLDEPPDSPATPTVAADSDTSVTVTWSAPDVTGKPPLTDYDVRFYRGSSDPSNDSAWVYEGESGGHTHTGTATSATITGLICGLFIPRAG